MFSPPPERSGILFSLLLTLDRSSKKVHNRSDFITYIKKEGFHVPDNYNH